MKKNEGVGEHLVFVLAGFLTVLFTVHVIILICMDLGILVE